MSVASPKRGLMIAAPRSGSGKTTLTLGLLRALCARGVAVAGAEVGSRLYRRRVSRGGGEARERQSRFLGDGASVGAGAGGCASTETATRSVEASMGLFDGAPAAANATGASADIAAWLGLPVVLILDVSGQAQSAAAIAKGFASYDARIAHRRHRAQQGRQRAAPPAGRRRHRGAGPAGPRRAAASGRHRPARAPSRPRAG